MSKTNTKSKLKFDTESENSTEVSRGDSSTGLISSPVINNIFQTIGGSVNTDMMNGLVSQASKTVSGFFNTILAHPFLQNDANRGWILVSSAILGAFFLISMLWQFIFSFMLTYASVKVILWFLENYEPDETSDNTIGDSYVSEKNPVDVIEYLVVLLFVMALTPLSYLPYMSLIINGSCVLLSITSLASKKYRQKVCRFVKNMLVSPDYIPGREMEGKIHSSLQTFCYTIETLNIGTFNMASNSRIVYLDLKNSESLMDGLKRLTRRPIQIIENTKQHTRDSSKKKDDDFEDDLDESFD